MNGPTEQQSLVPARSVASLPRPARRQALIDSFAWAAWYSATLTALNLWDLPLTRPALSVGLALGIAVACLRPRLLVLAPAMLAAVVGAALAAEALNLSPVLAAGCMAGGIGGLIRREPGERTASDAAQGALAGLAATGLGAWAAASVGWGHLGATALMGVISAQSIWPSAVKWGSRAGLPSPRDVKITLAEPYRAPVLKALDILAILRTHRPDADTLSGLEEVSSWVYRLALTLQTLDRELTAVDPAALEERIHSTLAEIEATEDPFTRERRTATAAHLRQLLSHTDQIKLERQRNASLQEYAVAYLEEARLGLLLARTLPGDATPARLDEVLDRLRGHTRDGDARRQTAREVQSLLN